MYVPIAAIMVQQFEFFKDGWELEALVFGNQLTLVDCGILLAPVDPKFRYIALVSYIFVNNLSYQIEDSISWKSLFAAIELRDVIQGFNTFLAIPTSLHE